MITVAIVVYRIQLFKVGHRLLTTDEFFTMRLSDKFLSDMV